MSRNQHILFPRSQPLHVQASVPLLATSKCRDGSHLEQSGGLVCPGGTPHLGVPPVGKKAATALKGETGCGVGVLCLLCAVDSCLWEGLFLLPHPRESLCQQANAVEGMSQPQAVTPEECEGTGAYREGSLPTLFVTCSKEHRRLCPGIRPLFVWKA